MRAWCCQLPASWPAASPLLPIHSFLSLSSFFFVNLFPALFQTKLEDGKYGGSADFAKDMRLIWKNAMTYNRPDSDIFETAEKLAKLFEKKVAKIKSNKKARTDAGAGAPEGDKEANREVTRADRLKFSSMVSSLTSEQLGSLVQMIQKECPEAINDVSQQWTRPGGKWPSLAPQPWTHMWE